MVIVPMWTARECRALRNALGLSQPEFAARVGVSGRTIKRWESGRPPGISPGGQSDLGTELAKLTPGQSEAFGHLLGEENTVERRQLFQAAGAFSVAAAGASIIGRADPETAERISAAAAGRPDLKSVEVVRSTLHAAMKLDDQLGSPAASGLVSVQQQLTESMLGECGPELRPALLSLHAEWVGFSGCLAWDAGDYAKAAQQYETAYESAHDAEDDDLAAYMLCHLSQLAIWQDRRRIAIDRALAARSWVEDSADRRLSAYVSLRMAEAAALNHQRSAALAALDDAERDLTGLDLCDPQESRAYFVGSAMLESYRGNVLGILGDTVAAISASKRAADLMGDPYTRDRAVTLLELSRPLVAAGDIDEAADVIGEAADLTAQNRSPRLAASVITERHKLAPWASAPAVRQLDERLVARDIVKV